MGNLGGFLVARHTPRQVGGEGIYNDSAGQWVLDSPHPLPQKSETPTGNVSNRVGYQDVCGHRKGREILIGRDNVGEFAGNGNMREWGKMGG